MLIACATSTHAFLNILWQLHTSKTANLHVLGSFIFKLPKIYSNQGSNQQKKVYRSYTTKISYNNRKKATATKIDNNTATQMTVKTKTISNRKH